MRLRQCLPYVILIALPAMIYSQVIGFEFLAFDDELLLLDNTKVHGLSFAHLKQIFTTFDPELYVPLTLLTYQIEYSLFGLSPVVVHTTNLLLHFLNTVLVFLLFRRFFAEWPAVLLALLFSLHPLNTEAVAWASARKDLLSASFFLGSILAYLRTGERGTRPILSILLFLFGLLAKVSIFPLPFVLLLLDWVRGRTITKTVMIEKAPYFFLAAVFLVIALLGKPTQISMPGVSVLLSFVAIPQYLLKFLVPVSLSIFYPFTDPVSVLHPRIAAGILGVLVATGMLAWSLRFTRKAVFAGLWFLLLIGPSLLNVVKGDLEGSYDFYIASDRYAYLAMIGLLFGVGWVATKIMPSGPHPRFDPSSELRAGSAHYRLRGALGMERFLLPGFVVFFGVLSFRQAQAWATSEALFAATVEQGKPSHVALNNLAAIRVRQNRLEEALALLERSVTVKKNARALWNLGQVRLLRKEYPEAIAVFEELVEFSPLHAHAHAKLGGLYLEKNDVRAAVAHLEKAQAIDPNIPSVHYNMGLVFEYLGQRDLARIEFERVLELDPEDAQAMEKLGLVSR